MAKIVRLGGPAAMIGVDKGVPIPKQGSGRRESKYPWNDMKPGDSFFVQGKKINGLGKLTYDQTQRRKGWKFTCRTVDGGVRVWRIA